ncbi:hypothetical protein DPMN_086662 [Dreissena polymorpha]|uniref:Uncharacterized protein n=1 Tax=Dreissena polymorpha TaxID=45954 RepID=A0A9D4KRL0_DREPO|nr:hypothetical protein DPMN_147315 [Dreissena polymorpha]KAH3844404.1 hypothetical protein DPMN_086662 [Dreissena polymorpha]
MEHHQGNLTSTITEDKRKVKVQVELTPISPSPSPENVDSHHENNLLESICSENDTSITTSTSPYNAGLYTSALPYMTWNTGGQLTASPYLLSSQSTSLSTCTSVPAPPNLRRRANTPLQDEKVEGCCCAKIQKLEKTITDTTNKLETLIKDRNDEILDAMTKTLQYQQELFNTYLNSKKEDETLKNFLINMAETTMKTFKK